MVVRVLAFDQVGCRTEKARGFLLSQEASNITGSTYNTDGGFTIF
ncbi:hypothetical protein [Rhodovulum sp.]|nr:hypothetical protein [Rhodovulum sp.]